MLTRAAMLLSRDLVLAAQGAAAGAFELFRQPASLVLVLGLATLVPFAFMALTAFVKISTVLQIVKSAIGVQSVPSNSIVVALAAALTLLAMAPDGSKIIDRAAPLVARGVAPDSLKAVGELWHAVGDPMRDFLRANASTNEKDRFFDL